jgi:branched-subunit amino acid aminotransferase/4-amino-4-deoxychorismate lyase
MLEIDGVAADIDQVRSLALTNYGHFTTMRVAGERVRGLSLHLDRLVSDCRRLFDAELDSDRVRHFVRHALAGVAQPVVVRVTVFDPALEIGHPGADARPHVMVTTRPAAHGPVPPLRLQSVQYRREMPEVKHVGLCSSLRHRRAAQRNGFDDVLFHDADAVISEAATSNIGVVVGDHILWPQADCLPGVTMQLITQSSRMGVSTAPIRLADLPQVDAAFATNAGVGVRPVHAVDGTRWADGHPALRVLQRQYADMCPEHL